MSSSVLYSFFSVLASSIRANQVLHRPRTSQTSVSSPSRHVGPFHARTGSSFTTSWMSLNLTLKCYLRLPPSVTHSIVKAIRLLQVLNQHSPRSHRQTQRHLLVQEKVAILYPSHKAHLFLPPLAIRPRLPVLLGRSQSTFPHSSTSIDGLWTSWRMKLKSTPFLTRKNSSCSHASAAPLRLERDP